MSETNEPSPDKTERKTFLDLSLTQIIGGSLAAASAAALGARLGVAGTILGAAVASIFSAVGGAFYTRSLQRTAEMIKATDALKARELLQRAGNATTTLAMPIVRDEPTGSSDDPSPGPGEDEVIEEAVEEATPSALTRLNWKMIGAATAVIFAIAAVALTTTELITGHSVGNSDKSTSLFGGHHSTTTPTPITPRNTESSSPSPSSDPSGTPTPSGSSTPTPTPTPSGDPSAGTSTSPTPTPTPNSTATATPDASEQ